MDIEEWKAFIKRYHPTAQFERHGEGCGRAVIEEADGSKKLVGTFTPDGVVWFAGKGSGVKESKNV